MKKRIVSFIILALIVVSNASAGPIGHIVKAPFKTVGYIGKGVAKVGKGVGEIVYAPFKALF
jgi:hypothetical protein